MTPAGRHAGKPLDWVAELIRARDRNDARHRPNHRKEQS